LVDRSKVSQFSFWKGNDSRQNRQTIAYVSKLDHLGIVWNDGESYHFARDDR
jgi:hypothetical protein